MQKNNFIIACPRCGAKHEIVISEDKEKRSNILNLYLSSNGHFAMFKSICKICNKDMYGEVWELEPDKYKVIINKGE